MQTFLPYPDFELSVRALDNRRLGKQRVEAKQILLTLEKGPLICAGCRLSRIGIPQECSVDTAPFYGVHQFIKTPWSNHPAVKMWRNHERRLALYGMYACREWKRRGFNDSLEPWFAAQMLKLPVCKNPRWVGDVTFHLSHQSNLVRKNLAHYGPIFPEVSADLPYAWPTID